MRRIGLSLLAMLIPFASAWAGNGDVTGTVIYSGPNSIRVCAMSGEMRAFYPGGIFKIPSGQIVELHSGKTSVAEGMRITALFNFGSVLFPQKFDPKELVSFQELGMDPGYTRGTRLCRPECDLFGNDISTAD